MLLLPSVLDIFDFRFSLAPGGKKRSLCSRMVLMEVTDFLQVMDVEFRGQKLGQTIPAIGIRVEDEDDFILEVLHRPRQK